ncbi:MAG TPA: helix-turn-helix domain-containing protein [Solirubrobacterales bacterium]|nr:helix-turn-helix domain-containing protein [Solirubrobacterales bacterium]
MITAVCHPLRRRILRAYLDESLECASAGELAKAMDQGVGQVSYHLKTLARCDVLRLVRSETAREGEGASYGWALDVEADWLRVLLDFWSESRTSR